MLVSEDQSKTRAVVSRSLSASRCSLEEASACAETPEHANSGFAFIHIQLAHGMSMVVTLYAGNVSVSDEPLTAIVPMDTGVTGSPAELCADAVVAVI